ncbi:MULTISPECIES: hypothetical protein [Streptococcus]|mgnify:FL=1|uniref:Uncharacterized protein n=1 Tax=Streptococcus oralis subsp. oralis TaxID=1891914 RepID=A0A1X1IEW2_STROR|nr:hypothetical protein [Streptococcus oralis]MCY7072985.1 hypothetical protein [Streptococcus oralis]ORO56783.1 hypothetical protein B7721_02645 [Streptococcus oralis subsp. oralis]ORO63416.1 hypothetical protein B7716_00800 [Streptococcus oralis subsp. oralis]ORO71724.1 hypothetical protein B7710_07840 [Streptococcus oralis subsp. oralis]
MRKDTKMDAHVTRSGYRYYTPTQKKSEVTKPEEEKKWKKGLSWLGKAIWSGIKNLPSVIARAAVLMVATPLMFLLFIFNLIKSLIATAIGWVVFKIVVVLGYAAFWEIYFWITKSGPSADVEKQLDWLMTNFFFPQKVPIYYWWETTIIVVLAVITALSLTFRPTDET